MQLSMHTVTKLFIQLARFHHVVKRIFFEKRTTSGRLAEANTKNYKNRRKNVAL